MAVIKKGLLIVLGELLWLTSVSAQVLPEDKVSAGYRYYDGGDVKVSGPVLMLRKNIDNRWLVRGGLKVDSVSSASIDVMSYASPYSDKRTEYELAADYTHGDLQLGMQYINSSESDYDAQTVNFDTSEQFFGGLTQVNLGVGFGWDTVGENGNAFFSEEVRRNQFRLGLSQVITKNMVAALNYEAISEEGFLSSPYRRAVVAGSLANESYPETRTAGALAGDLKVYLPKWRSALRLNYRFYSDSWDIKAHTAKVSYSLPISAEWLLDLRLRYYQQSAASFYADRHARALNYVARDKELSDFSSISYGVDAQYSLADWRLFEQPGIHFAIDYLSFNYNNFYIYGDGQGVAPLLSGDMASRRTYSFDALVMQIYLTSQF